MNDRPSRCSECTRPLAHDQRYCLRCGARRGPLPARIGLTIGEILERGRALPVSGAELSTPPAPAAAPAGTDDLVPAARSAAVAILLMIAFGCVVGSLSTPGGVEALARQLVVAVTPAQSTPAVTAAASTGSSNSGSSNNSAPAPASFPAASAPSPAAPVQQTVTVGSSATPTSATTPPPTTTPVSLLGLPPIKHVWEVVLSQQGYNQAFATTTGHPYLATHLRHQGKLITGYYGVAQSPLANEIALISGQGPTPQTIAGCPTFADIIPATIGHLDQIMGTGCLYPQSALTLPDQLAKAGLAWRAYVQGIGEKPSSQTTSSTTTSSTTTSSSAAGPPAVPASQTCPHPAFGGADPYQSASVDAPYVTWRNPFVYFRSLLIGGKCASSDVGLDRLATDLKQLSTAPAFSYLSPGPCNDGSDQPCSANAPAGLAQADRFLKTVVPEIERSPAYKKDGLIAITFDGAPQSGPQADLTSCCNQPAFPNLPKPSSTTSNSSTTPTATPTTPTATPTTPATTTTTSTAATSATGATTTTSTTTSTSCTTSSSTSTTTSTTTTAPTTPTTTTSSSGCTPPTALPPGTNPGGGKVGLLLISRYIKPNSVDQVAMFNHFSLLKSIEDLFGLKPLGYARDTAVPVLDASIFSAAKE